MQNNFIECTEKVCKILNEHSVEYLIVGGTAVALHGYYRPSCLPSGAYAGKHDLDIWYNPSYANYNRVLDALDELGVDVSRMREEKAPNPKKSFFKLNFEKFTLDLVPELPGLSRFISSYNKRAEPKVGELTLPTISYEELLLSKKTLGREKDIEDIKQLNLRKGGKGKSM
jgi:hypothetical protein